MIELAGAIVVGLLIGLALVALIYRTEYLRRCYKEWIGTLDATGQTETQMPSSRVRRLTITV
jgi:hypothetical protein